MGDPRRQHKKYVTPKTPWNTERMQEELYYVGTYGLRNKREFWKHRTELSRIRRQARHILALPPEERIAEENKLFARLQRMGILSDEPTLDEVLGLKIENLLERRLQTIVYRKGMATSIYHARQLITHGHITLDGRRVTTPSRIILKHEEDLIDFALKSPLRDENHPARTPLSAQAGGGTSEATTNE